MAAGPLTAQVRPGGHCQQPKAQNLRVLLLWGDDSKAKESAVNQNREGSVPRRHNPDRLHILFQLASRLLSPRCCMRL